MKRNGTLIQFIAFLLKSFECSHKDIVNAAKDAILFYVEEGEEHTLLFNLHDVERWIYIQIISEINIFLTYEEKDKIIDKFLNSEKNEKN